MGKDAICMLGVLEVTSLETHVRNNNGKHNTHYKLYVVIGW